MISEMKKSLNAILYERVTSPLSGIFILAWLCFNWKACLILAYGNDTIYQRILFVSSHYANPYSNFYYPALYTVIFIILYPWVALAPFYLWQLSNHFKMRIKNRLDLQTPLSLEKSIELRKELRQKEKELVDMLSAKNTKQLELEAEIVHLNSLFKDLEDKRTSGSEPTQRRVRSEEEIWDEEYKNVYVHNPYFTNSIENILEGLASNKEIHPQARKYGLGQGLITISPNGVISLTQKGTYMSKFNDPGWDNAIRNA